MKEPMIWYSNPAQALADKIRIEMATHKHVPIRFGRIDPASGDFVDIDGRHITAPITYADKK